MPIVENTVNNKSNPRASRSVSFAEALEDPREEEPMFRSGEGSPDQQEDENGAAGLAGLNRSDEAIDDGTGRRFKIPFQEHRLRFDQTFPDGLDMRIPISEYEIVLEQIHRDFVEPLDKSQTSVRKWSAITAGTAPIGVGFFLSIVLARRVNRHQKSLKTFWISLRQHLKSLNRDIYFARGIEWRIEKDLEKIEDRDAYNKLHAFRIEIVFRKPIAARSGREMALKSIVESITTSQVNSSNSSNRMNFTDPQLLALLTTIPGGELYSYHSDYLSEPTGPRFTGGEPEDNRTGNDSPVVVSDHEDSLLLKFDEPSDVKQARISSNFEPPSPTPEASIFTGIDGKSGVDEETKMTFADLLRLNLEEEDAERDSEATGADSSLGAVTDAIGFAAASLQSNEQPNSEPLASSDPSQYSREEAFARRQRQKFSRNPTLKSQLYAIPESPTLGSEDPTGDAMNYLTQQEDEDDLIDAILGPSAVFSASLVSNLANFEEPRPVTRTNFDNLGSTPIAAYPMADPFSPLYETETLVPLDPVEPGPSDDLEYTEVDGEVEYVRRKKWRVAPERAHRLSRTQTMTESIHPASRRSSYLPLTKISSVPKTFEFK